MKARGAPRAATVYSTDRGRMCPECGQPLAGCRCRRAKARGGDSTGAGDPGAAPRADGVVRVGRETAGRKGKTVTVVSGAPLGGSQLEALAKELRQLCGAGGTVKGGRIEIQGDHGDRVAAALQGKGWRVK